MSAEPALFDYDGEPTPEARARTSDPETSHAAAGSLTPDRIRASQQAVLVELGRHRFGLTDHELVEAYTDAAEVGRVPMQSPSGIRSRRHELVDAGLVVDTGARIKLASGRNAIVWAVAP
ncbi:hypothetical protein [Mycobacterium phage Weirdo19]|uniref:Helix-turn-helix DNA binding domain protein n=1 Tax=Mycobacterium phage Weirdo19 TaxID=2601610 RepID=A0A6M2YSR3_9CAUD|nr:hypothetical protein KDJ11_gp60 [Mycobacterium phage Weirdo19]QEA10828.1 hypothetical protein [Mycobacterium phage Weirdo19]